MTHVAHQHERTAFERQRATVRGAVVAVGVQGAGDDPAAFFKALGKVALHQAQPVAVSDDLVFSVHGGDGVFAVHDGGHSALNQDVFDLGFICAANRVVAVDLDFEVQIVVLEQDRGWRVCCTHEASKLRRISERRC